MRNHPAVSYYKSGIPIVIAGDDPGSFGYNDLTFDYYLAFMSWGMSLLDLREIANNSIRHSSLDNQLKLSAHFKFNKLWLNFLNTTFDRVCNMTKNDLINNVITHVYPPYGPNDKSILISMYGYSFESVICERRIFCFFDDIETNGHLDSLNELMCETPLGFGHLHTSSLGLSFGNRRMDTGLTYTFVSSYYLQ